MFIYATTTARVRDPSRGLREIYLCSFHPIERIRNALRGVYTELVSYAEEFDPVNYYFWLVVLQGIYLDQENEYPDIAQDGLI